MQIDTVLTYRLHTNNENVREKQLLSNLLLKVDLAKSMPQFLCVNSKNDRVAENDSSLANVHMVSHGLQSHDCHVLINTTLFLKFPFFDLLPEALSSATENS